jgi:hypothetical protein
LDSESDSGFEDIDAILERLCHSNKETYNNIEAQNVHDSDSEVTEFEDVDSEDEDRQGTDKKSDQN